MTTRIRVLLVEDSEDDAALILLELKEGGYAPVHERVDTPAAMNAALDHGPWDIVLSDQNMPRFSAPEALRLLMDRGFEIPFIIVSGSIGEKVVLAAMKAGACDYVKKDTLGELCPAVDRALRIFREREASRRALDALRDSEERFALAMLASRDGLWDWSVLSEHTYYSSRFKQMLGFEEHEFGGPLERFVELVHEDDRPLLRRMLAEHMAERTACDLELRVGTKQDGYKWFAFRGQALWDDAGKATRMAGSLRDLTARKRAEEALTEQLLLIQQQQEAIRTLSMPIIEVWEGVLTVPVLGVLDSKRAQEMMTSLLSAVSQKGCHHVIIDLTGVATMDATTADHLIKLVGAVELLGAQGVVVGIQPDVAQAIVALGVDLSRIVTLGNLGDALVLCLRRRRQT
jgi:anti-anti-sigma factor